MKKGFTLLEVLIAMFILVIVFGLVTFLYVKAASIRKIVVANSEIQQTLSQMMDTIIHGEKGGELKSLVSATKIYNHDFSPPPPPPNLAGYIDNSNYSLIFGNIYQTMVQYYLIAPGLENEAPDNIGTDTTLWYGESSGGSPPSSWSLLDINKKITITSGSKFEYFTPENTHPDSVDSETTLLVITLKAKSNEPALSNKAPVTLKTAIRLRNALPF